MSLSTTRWATPVLLVLALIAAVLFAVGDVKAAGKPAVYTGIVKGVALGGYDPVGYFTAGKPVRGRKDITLDHGGATWRFASQENKEAFAADPAKYAPQYGGYCAWAVSRGYTAKGDPNAWKIVNGKLYLNYNQSVRRTWLRNTEDNISRGDANWPKVLTN